MPRKATRRELIARLEKCLNHEYIINNTSVFSDYEMGMDLNPTTVRVIRDKFRIYFDSWIKNDVEEAIRLLKGKSKK